MKLSLDKFKQKRHKAKATERHRVIEFIHNHAAKADLIKWLNANYGQQFPEDKDWDELIKAVRADQDITTASLHNYANTLTDEEDVTKLLKDVEKETEKAEETVSELYDAAQHQRLRPIVGGACLLGGLLLLAAAGGLFTGALEIGIPAGVLNYIAAVSGLYGIITTMAGFLLVLE